jgi:hypothetical protein
MGGSPALTRILPRAQKKIDLLCIVIARESGQSSNHRNRMPDDSAPITGSSAYADDDEQFISATAP